MLGLSRSSTAVVRRSAMTAIRTQTPLVANNYNITVRQLSTSQEALALAQNQQLPPTDNRQKSWFQKVLDRVSIKSQQQRIIKGEQLFQAATRQANDARWYGPGRIPRDFRSRHAMVTMHVWFLHKRLVAKSSNGGLDEDTALQIQEELFDIFWNDTLCRLRQAGVREMSVNKSLLKVQQYTFLHLFHYDHIYQALASSQSHLDPRDDDHDHDHDDASQQQEPMAPPGSDDDEAADMDPLAVLDPNLDLTKVENRISELKKLIWMHIFVRDPEAQQSDDHLTRLAWYIEAQYQNILVDWPGLYVQQARVGWVNLPNFDKLRDNNNQLIPPQPVHPDDVLPEPWATNITLRGDVYYWNYKNGKSQWERPEGGTYDDDDSATNTAKA